MPRRVNAGGSISLRVSSSISSTITVCFAKGIASSLAYDGNSPVRNTAHLKLLLPCSNCWVFLCVTLMSYWNRDNPWVIFHLRAPRVCYPPRSTFWKYQSTLGMPNNCHCSLESYSTSHLTPRQLRNYSPGTMNQCRYSHDCTSSDKSIYRLLLHICDSCLNPLYSS